MSITRIFLDWRRPALPQAVEYLIERYADAGRLDLSRTLVVLPGSRAARRLLELLVDAAAERRLAFAPGELITIGALPERFYRAKLPFASELTQRAAWARTLQQAERSDLTEVAPHPPHPEDGVGWLELADLLRRLHLELAAEQRDFQDVADKIGPTGPPKELRRWSSLARIQKAYLELLLEHGLWDRQTARLRAIEWGECAIDRDVTLLGAVDLNRTLRAMLDQVAERVTTLTPAPPQWSDRFDSHGCLIPASWQEAASTIDDRRLHAVDRPVDQADQVTRCLASYGGRYRADEITIGVPDEDAELIAQIERRLERCGAPARWGPGKPVAQTSPCRLLEATADFLRTQGRAPFAALVRHPDVAGRLQRSGLPSRWLETLDDYLARQLPQQVEPPWLGDEEVTTVLDSVYRAVRELVEPLTGGARPLDQWIAAIRRLLSTLYDDDRVVDLRRADERAVWRACEALDGALAEFENVPAALMPRVKADDAIRLLLKAVRDETAPQPSDEPAVELLGWLELPLDDAPALIVTSFNDGQVPKAVNADPFLPNSIRSKLGLDDNERRFARDAYALAVLQASRRELDLIVGRRTSDGDPLAPSRLLLDGDGETVLRRVRKFFGDERTEPPLAPVRPLRAAPTGRVPLPVPTPEDITAREPRLAELPGVTTPLESIRVTQFKAYLACPYRFFLGHVLKLESASDEQQELDPLGFGSLLHDVLRDFGESDRRDSADVDQIRDALFGQLARLAQLRYGARPLPAVRVQIEQIRLRLAKFAEVQAQRAAVGWRIVHVERDRQTWRHPFDVDGRPIELVGRIDRIDRNLKTNRFEVLDYKTSRSGDRPERTHRRGAEWIDLQLPLYRYLARAAGSLIDGPLDLGYLLLPGDSSKTRAAIAQWTDEQLAEADEAARDVVRRLRRLEYWPRATGFRPDRDEFAGVCQTGVMGARR